MKHTLALSLLLLLGFFPAVAADLRATAEIPFPFVVAGKTLPAGEYDFIQLNPNALMLRGVQTKAGAICLMNLDGRAASTKTSLVFNRYEGQAFLSTVMVNGVAGHVVKSKAEKVLIAKQAGAVAATVLARNK